MDLNLRDLSLFARWVCLMVVVSALLGYGLAKVEDPYVWLLAGELLGIGGVIVYSRME